MIALGDDVIAKDIRSRLFGLSALHGIIGSGIEDTLSALRITLFQSVMLTIRTDGGRPMGGRP
jgi:hypothetical protein